MKTDIVTIRLRCTYLLNAQFNDLDYHGAEAVQIKLKLQLGDRQRALKIALLYRCT